MSRIRPEELGKFERSYCECGSCKAACRTLPGMLVPGDLQRIGNFEGVPPTTEWVREHFEASEGSLCEVDGKTVRVPVIVPAQRQSGRCIFLTNDDRCSIHPVAPYGCRIFNVCETPDSDCDHRSAEALACISGEPDYLRIWGMLKAGGCESTPISIRRENLRQEINKEIGGDHRQ